MLSILIPTYHYNVYPLAQEMARMADAADIRYEIICLDDGSGGFRTENEKINELPHASFSKLETNIGRSAIRNLLARKANYENLLFLDADVLPQSADFLQRYLPYLDGSDKIVYGGIRYQIEPPSIEQRLRWVYGNEREALDVETRQKHPYRSFLTLNFLTTKSVLATVPFNEAIPNLRHEDTFFSYELSKAGVPMVHIENPVWHHGLEDSLRFLQKSEEAIVALQSLVSSGLLPSSYARLSAVYTTLSRFGLRFLFATAFRLWRKTLRQHLLGTRPSMRLFDLYRLGYLCSIKKA